MINQKFRNNWLKILDFNRTRNILQDPEQTEVVVRIPLSPITVNANILYYLFEVLYPKFINDQQNILDIIIQDIDKKNNITNLFLYITQKAGIHETVESLPKKLLKIKNLEIEKLEEVFNKAQSVLLKEKSIQISSIRIFKKEAIDLINSYCKNIEELSLYEFFNQAMDLLHNLFEQDLILIYPEPIVINFIKSSISLLNEIRFRNLFQFIEDKLPEFHISLLIDAKTTKTIALAQKTTLKNGKSDLRLNFFTPTELDINIDDLNIKNTLNIIQDKLHTEKSYYINQNTILTFISDLFEILIPLKKENLKLLFQKALFGYRSFEKLWNMVPKPTIYNTLVRFLIRLIGFNLNLKKISHWGIPEAIFNYIDFFFGLNSRILLIITDQSRSKKIKGPQDHVIKNTCMHTILLEFEDSTLERIMTINKDKLFLDSNSNSLSSIRKVSIEIFGDTPVIIIIDKMLIREIVNNFVFNHSSFSFIPKFKTLKLLKNEKYFMIYPEFPFYKLMKNKGSLSLLKLIIPIMIDKFEF
ncbi:MAG: hypothetical protein ACFFDY_10660 [Candidatus Thorarchaeota archaeon]